MTSSKSIVLAVVLSAVLVAQSGFGQTRAVLDPDVRTDLASALRVIRPLVRDDPQRAIQMLEKLRSEYPTNSHVLVLLGDTYQVVGDTEAAREVYEACVRYHPKHLQAAASLGLLYVKNEQREQGERLFRGLLERTGGSVNTYRTIGSTLARNGFFDLALRYYQEGKARNENNYVLSLDIGHMRRSMGNYAAALQEYLILAETMPKHQRLAKQKIVELLRHPAADRDELVSILETDAARTAPGRSFVRGILAAAYLEGGMLERALEMALLADQEKTSHGAVLFRLADQAHSEYRRQGVPQRARYFDLALRALESYVDGYADGSQIPRAKLMMTDLLVDLATGRVKGYAGVPLDSVVTRSLETLDWIIASFPGTDYAEQAYLKKGDVAFRIQKRPGEALKIYQAGMDGARVHQKAFAERLGIVYLTTEEYDKAKHHFSALVGSDNEEFRETGVFYSGLLLSFTREYEVARDTLTSLAEGNPSSLFANDAIHLAWVIEEGLQGTQKHLNHYVEAIRLELAGDTTQVIGRLKGIADSPSETPLRARALVRLGELYDGLARYEAAVGVLEEFITDYPADTQLPDVHRRIGQIYEQGYGRADLALEKYEDILLSFPHYIYLDEVREDVTRLRGLQGEPQ